MGLTVYPSYDASAKYVQTLLTYNSTTAQVNSTANTDIIAATITLTSTSDILFMLASPSVTGGNPPVPLYYGINQAVFTGTPGQLIWTMREGASNIIGGGRTDAGWDIFGFNPIMAVPHTCLWFHALNYAAGTYTFTLAGREVTTTSSGNAAVQTCVLTAYVWR